MFKKRIRYRPYCTTQKSKLAGLYNYQLYYWKLLPVLLGIINCNTVRHCLQFNQFLRVAGRRVPDLHGGAVGSEEAHCVRGNRLTNFTTAQLHNSATSQQHNFTSAQQHNLTSAQQHNFTAA